MNECYALYLLATLMLLLLLLLSRLKMHRNGSAGAKPKNQRACRQNCKGTSKQRNKQTTERVNKIFGRQKQLFMLVSSFPYV